DELTEKELKQIEGDDQAIQTILLGLPEDIYAAVDSCETAQEIWLRVQQMMKGSDIRIQEKKAKLFNEWESRHVTIVHQTKDLHTTDYTQLYDFLKYNQKEVDELKAERLTKIQDPLALMANSNNPYAFPAPHQDQPSYNQNYMQQLMPNPEDITDLTISMNMELALMAKAFKLNYSTPTNNNQRISSNPRNRQIAQPGNANLNGNGNLIVARPEGNAAGQNGNQIRCYNCRGVAEVHDYENYDDNEIFNMFTQEEQYTKLLEPIPEQHQVPQNDNIVISDVTSMEQSGETVEQHPANFEETRALYDSLYHNLAIEVEKVNSVNRKLKETNADLTTKLARFKNQEKCFEISQEKYDKLERCYQQSVYQEKCLSKKIDALHLKKKKLKSDFKTREDELLDKQIQLEKKIKELNNILVKTSQTIHMLSPKPDSFYDTDQKMALGYQNPFYLKQAEKKQQSLYDGKVLLEKHDPPVVHDSQETLQLAQETRGFELEIKRLLRAVVSQDIMSVVKKTSVVDTSNLQTELERTKERFESGLPKFKYHKEHLCPSCEQGKSKRASHRPKPVLNSRQRLHLLHMDLCGPMRIASINGKRYVLVIIDDYFRYTWVHFLRSKDEAPEVIKAFLKRITVLQVYNRRTKKIMETINVSFDELLAMAFEQRSSKPGLQTMAFEQSSSKPGLQSMTSGQISSGLDLSYAPSTITTQQPSEGELDLLFEAMYDDYIGGQLSATARTILTAKEPQVRQTSTASTTIADTVPTPTNSSSQAIIFSNTSQDVNELNLQQQHVQQQGNQVHLQSTTISDNVSNAMFDGNTFVNPFANPSTSAAESSSSHNVDPLNMHTFYQPYPHKFQWTKDHPLEQVIGEPSR
nr:Gag-Pol polyprotein [Tanacetum cinerariifolium]